MHGTAVTGGESASHHFEYGRTAAYGSSTGEVTLPGANGQTTVSFAVTGLPAQSSIHYRLVVSTRDGTARSGDQEFSDVVPPPNNNHPGGAGSGGSAKLRNVAIVKHTLHFTLSRAVKLTVRIQRVVTGHKRHATCSTRIKHGPRCTIVTSVWSKTVRLGAGADKLGLPTLTNGSYRLTLTPAGGKPITRTLSVK